VIYLLMTLTVVAAQLGTLKGYVFREADGGPPRRPLTIELINRGKSRYRETTNKDGGFAFNKLREGRYTIRARFSDYTIAEESVLVTSGEKNFAAVMMPKRRTRGQGFRTVTADQLSAQSDRKLQKIVRQAVELTDKGDLAGAAVLLEQAAAKGSQPEYLDGLGVLYLRLGRKDQAFHSFEKAIEQDPNYLLPYNHLATVYLEERRYKDLLGVAKRALAIDSNWLSAYAFLAEAQVGIGDLPAAQRSAETASELARGKAPGPYLLQAKIRWTRKDCAGARILMERYLELNTSVRKLPETLKSLEILRACGSVPTP
jgi:tetratricopeptide (TPR) repeat protein